MSSFSVYRNIDTNNTFVSNIFIDEYMTEANAAQIKVYLYLLRMNGQSTSVSDMADRFNYIESDICRALKYWEKKHLLSIDYDLNGSVVGVRLIEPAISASGNTGISMSSPVQISNTAVMNKQAEIHTFIGREQSPTVVSTSNDTENAIEDQEEQPRFVKPNYTADELRAFKDREDMKQIMFIASAYLGKTLSPNDIKSLIFISDTLNFSMDLIDYLIEYCAEKDKKNFKYIETVAINWANDNITTPEQAKALSGKYDKSVYTVMKALGKSSAPTEKEADFVRRWTNEFGFTTDVILEACERCVLSTDKNRFAYADSILKNWRNAGVVVKSDIAAVEAKSPRPYKKASGQTSFHRLDMKHNYDYSEMEEALLKQN